MTAIWSVPESDVAQTDWPVSPPPPWPATVRATIWWHRATTAARSLVGGDLPTLPITAAMVVDYLDSPVGPYREILASPVLVAPRRRFGSVPRLHVPFIAVDSDESVHGGRTHWLLPKTKATFDGDVGGLLDIVGDGWSARTRTQPGPVPLPIAGAVGFVQPDASRGPDAYRRASATLYGTCRTATIDVEATGPTLPDWLTPGRHRGITITRGRMRTGPGRDC